MIKLTDENGNEIIVNLNNVLYVRGHGSWCVVTFVGNTKLNVKENLQHLEDCLDSGEK